MNFVYVYMRYSNICNIAKAYILLRKDCFLLFFFSTLLSLFQNLLMLC